jgi:hypothetical protein
LEQISLPEISSHRCPLIKNSLIGHRHLIPNNRGCPREKL